MNDSLSPKRAAQVQNLFDEAVELDADARAAYLDQACDDDALRRQVEALLTAHDNRAGKLHRILEHILLAPQPTADTPEHRERQPLKAPMYLPEGTHIAHYEVSEKLGSGSMGVVYKAVDTMLKRTVALKFLPSYLSANEEAKARFVREAQAASSLDHPGIGTIYEIGETDDGQLFIAMAYYAGETLKQKIERGSLPVEEALNYTMQMAEGLGRAHEAGIVHRDIKPANVLVTERGQSKIVDFGIAKVQDVNLTQTGSTLGTVFYMSPEQARGQTVDCRTDLWSLGVTLYEMLTGEQPFQGEYTEAILYAICNNEPKPVQALRSEVPEGLVQVVGKLLRKDLEARYQTAEAVLDDLRAVRRGETPSGSRSRWLPTTKHLIPLVVLAVLAIAIIQFIVSSSPTPSGEPSHRTQLTSYPGDESFPAFSPDGNQIAFSWTGEGQDNWDIYIKQPGVGTYEPIRLTTHPDIDYAPVWSPDGRFIAFLRHDETKYPTEIGLYRIPALGGTTQKLTSLQVPSPISWSPDGTSLFFVDIDSAGARSSVYAMSLETLEREKLTDPPEGFEDLDARISPNGSLLAYARGVRYNSPPAFHNPLGALRFRNADVYVVSLPGGTPRQLSYEGSTIQGLAWTPDSREIIYASDRFNTEGSLRLWWVPVSGGASHAIPTRGDRDLYPALSPNGQRLAYVEAKYGRRSIWQYEISTTRNAPPERLIYSSASEVSAEYSPDGSRIVFASTRTGNDEIWVSDSDGGNPVQLTFMGGPLTGTPRWSPDGRFIAFDSYSTEGKASIYVISAEGGNPRRITPDSMNAMQPFWSQDGEWIYYSQRQSWDIGKVHVRGVHALRAIANGFSPRESPDGKWIYYYKWSGVHPQTDEIWRKPVSGGDESMVLDNITGGYWGSWAVFDDGIYYLDWSGQEGAAFAYFDFNTMKVARILQIPYSINGSYIHVSPDRKHALITHGEPGEVDLVFLEHWR